MSNHQSCKSVRNTPARINLELSPALLAWVDEIRGDIPRNRWIRHVIADRIIALSEKGELDLSKPPNGGCACGAVGAEDECTDDCASRR